MSVSEATCFLFDFDGTLAPNLDLPEMRRQVIALTLSRGVPEAVFKDHYMVEIIEIAAAWLAESEPTTAATYFKQAHGLITDFELAAAAEVDPFPQARPLLSQLRSLNLKTAVVTRNCEAAVRCVFPDIDGYCDLLLARDQVTHLKPDPRHLQLALDTLQQTPEQAVMIGDGRMDMHTGAALGLFCVGVLSGSSDSPTLLAAGADLILPDIQSLAAHL